MSSDDDEDYYDLESANIASDECPPSPISVEAKLNAAIYNGNLEEVNAILESSVNPSKLAAESLPYVIECGKVEVLRKMLKHYGTEKNKPRSYTGLMAAANSSREATLECAKVLLEANADPNFRDKKGMTALMYAARNNRVDITDELIERGANIELRDSYGWTALYYAVEEKNVEVARYLKTKGAKDNICDLKSHFPYHVASNKGFKILCDTILTKPPLSSKAKFNAYIAPFIAMPDDPLDEIKSGFQTHAFQLLVELGAGIYLQKFKEAEITLYELLNISEERLKEIGVPIKARRVEILKDIRAFHFQKLNPRHLNVREEMNIQNALNSLSNCTKSLCIMRSTLEYLNNNLDTDGLELNANAQDLELLGFMSRTTKDIVAMACRIYALTDKMKECPNPKNRKNLISVESCAIVFVGTICAVFFYKCAREINFI